MSDDKSQKFHFKLVTGLVTYRESEEATECHSAVLNILAPLQHDYIPVGILGQMQSELQEQLFERLGQPVPVSDVSITSISPLGHMTIAQFEQGMPKPEPANKEADSAATDLKLV